MSLSLKRRLSFLSSASSIVAVNLREVVVVGLWSASPLSRLSYVPLSSLSSVGPLLCRASTLAVSISVTQTAHSYNQPSSSSVRLCSREEPEVSSTTREYGIPNLCYCGLRTMMKTTNNMNEYLGRMFFGCKDYKDGPMHLLKWWDEAMMEEFILLRRATDNQGDCIRVLRLGDRIEAELAQLKQLALMEKKRYKRVDLSIVIVLVVVLVGLIIEGCMSRF